MVSVPVGEVVAGQPGEDLEDAGGGGRGAAAVFGIYRELFHATGFHGRTDLAFDRHCHVGECRRPGRIGGVSTATASYKGHR